MDSPVTTPAPRSAKLLQGAVPETLLRLAGPMVLGILAILLFGLVDTWYVGRLGAQALAAMSFTFPVTVVLFSVAMGVGLGATAVISAAIGQQDRKRVRRLTTHALLLANLLVVVFATVGLAGHDTIFSLLGADRELRLLIADYMVPWLLGIGLLVVPIVGNSAIRATGDTRTPSVVMLVAGLVNAALDPVLIFGLGPFPRLGLQGAALATVISWCVTFGAALWILTRRERMIEWRWPRLAELWASWKPILHVGVPAAGAQLLVPLATGVLTRLVSREGPEAVAAFGVGSRIESLALIGVSALGAAVVPFVGQNAGAARWDRVRAGVSFSIKAGLAWGVGGALLLAALAGPLGRLFSDDAAVVEGVILFLRLVPASYGPYAVALLAMAAFNGLQRPLRSASLITVRLVVLAVPLAWLGSRLWGLPGVFGALGAANLGVGVVAGLSLLQGLRAHAGPTPRPMPVDSGPTADDALGASG